MKDHCPIAMIFLSTESKEKTQDTFMKPGSTRGHGTAECYVGRQYWEEIDMCSPLLSQIHPLDTWH